MIALDLPDFDRATADALAIIAPRLPVELFLAGHKVVACFPSPGTAPAPQAWPRISGSIADHPITLQVGPHLIPQAAIAAFPELPTVGVDEGLRGILLDLLLQDISDATESLTGARPFWHHSDPDIAARHLITLRSADTSGDVLAVLHLSDGALIQMAPVMQTLPAHQSDVSDLPLRCTLLLDRFSISLQELQCLAPGDVLLMDRDPVSPDGGFGAVLQIPGARSMRAQVRDSHVELLSDVDSLMTDSPTTEPQMDALHLPVAVTIGTLELPISRLSTLAVGEVLDIGLDATERVSLTVNGQVIADGELIRIAGRVGVRITTLSAAKRMT